MGELKEKKERLEEIEKEIESKKKAISNNNSRHTQLKQVRDRQANERKDMWRKKEEMKEEMKRIEEEKGREERNLQINTNRLITSGIKGVMKLKEKYKIKGVYGPLLELFTCDPVYFTAVEVTAGNALFHIVVDTEKTASKLLELFNKEKIEGRVTFMPLNKLTATETEIPAQSGVKSMIESALKFEETVRKAFLQVFGRTVLCENLELASSFATLHQLDCITLEGDRVDRKGALSGGFYDSRSSRLEIFHKIKSFSSTLLSKQKVMDSNEAELSRLEELLNHSLSEIHTVESEKALQGNAIEQLSLDKKTLLQEIDTLSSQVEQKKTRVNSIEENLSHMRSSKSSLEKEKNSAFSTKLSKEEEQEMREVTNTISDLKGKSTDVLQSLSSVQSQINEINNNLRNNLHRRKQQLTEDGTSGSLNADEQKALKLQSQNELKEIDVALDKLKDSISSLDKSVDSKSDSLQEIQNNIDKALSLDNSLSKKLQGASKQIEKLLNERSALMQKKEQATRKIRDVGWSISSQSAEEFQNLDVPSLMLRLESCNDQLKNYSHINKKAGDQYVSFIEQRDTLQKRKQKLDEDQQSISELVKVLDGRKDEAIERTFKGVSMHFTHVFEKLVGPEGKGRLVMMKPKQKKRTVEGEAPPSSEQPTGINQYTGIKIEVSFPGAKAKPMQLYSGGQRSLVSLALIFAIQRCDPAPFYLFDEIDSALDPAYRASVANLISKQAETAQFIVTTFKNELVIKANKFYKVEIEDKSSVISVTDQKGALEVLRTANK